MVIREKLRILKEKSLDQFSSKNLKRAGSIGIITATLTSASCILAEAQTTTVESLESLPTPVSIPHNNKSTVWEIIKEKPVISPAPKSDYEKLKEKGCPNTRLRIRVTEPENIKLVPQICFGGVRIAVDHTSFYTNPKVKEAISIARSLNLKVLAVLNPHQLEPLILPNGEVKTPEQQVIDLLTIFPDIDLEIGNEPDDTVIKFWRNQDLEAFTKYFKKVYKEAIKISPNINIIIPATADIAKTKKLWQLIARYDENNPEDVKVNMSRVKRGAHVYNEINNIKIKLSDFKTDSITYDAIKDNIVFTEVAVQGPNTQVLSEMLNYIRDDEKMHHNVIFVHELENPHSEKRGITYPGQNILDRRLSDRLKDWAIKDLERFPEHRYLPANNRNVRNNPRRFNQRRYGNRKII